MCKSDLSGLSVIANKRAGQSSFAAGNEFVLSGVPHLKGGLALMRAPLAVPKTCAAFY